MRLILSIIFFHLACTYGLAQGFNIQQRHIGPEDGLLTRKVNCLLQDQTGMIWIGTHIGLQLYDGHRFQNFSNSAAESHRIVGNHINHLMEDDLGRIWVSTTNGFSIIQPNIDHRIIQYTPSQKFIDQQEHVYQPHVTKTFQLSNGDILVKVDHQIFTWNEEERILDPYFDIGQYRPLYKSSRVDNIIEYQDRIFISSRLGVFNKPLEPNTTQFFKETPGALYLVENECNQEEELYKFTNQDSVFRWDQNKKSFLFDFKLTENIWSYFTIQNGNNILFRTIDTWAKLNICDQSITLFPSQLPAKVYVHQIIQDRNEDIWVATNFGIYILKIKEQKLEKLLHTSSDSGRTFNYSIRAIAPFNDSCTVFSAQDYLWTKCPAHQPQQIHAPNLKSVAYKIIQVGKNEFVSTNKYNFYHFKIENNTYQTLHAEPLHGYYAALKRENGKLIVGTAQGLIEYDPLTRKSQDITIKGISKDRFVIRVILSDDEKGLWMGTRSGVYRLDSFFTVREMWNVSTSPALSANLINGLLKASDDRLWISTNGGGVNILNIEESTVEILDQMDGLSNNVTYGISERDGHFWIPTDHGLSIYDPKLKAVRNLYQSDGLSHNEFNFPSNHTDQQGNLLLGTLDGVTVIPPDFIIEDSHAPDLFVSGVESNGVKVDYSKDQKINFREKDEYLKIDLGLSDYFRPTEHQYFYRFQKGDTTWKYNEFAQLQFNSFDKRNQVLELKGVNERGSVTDILPIKIRYSPKFTSTLWFPISAILLFAVAIYLLYLYRLQSLNRVVVLRQKISDDLHDEVGSMLTQIAVQSELAMDDSFDKKDKEHMLTKIADTGREAISAMGDMVWAIDSSNDSLGDLQTRMQQTINNLLGPKNIQTTFVVNGLSVDKKINLSRRQNIYLIFKEAIHNIAKHSDATHVDASLAQENGTCQLTIHDNGTSFDQSKIGHGKGWFTMQKRAEALQGSIQSNTDNGVYIRLVIPAI